MLAILNLYEYFRYSPPVCSPTFQTWAARCIWTGYGENNHEGIIHSPGICDEHHQRTQNCWSLIMDDQIQRRPPGLFNGKEGKGTGIRSCPRRCHTLRCISHEAWARQSRHGKWVWKLGWLLCLDAEESASHRPLSDQRKTLAIGTWSQHWISSCAWSWNCSPLLLRKILEQISS